MDIEKIVKAGKWQALVPKYRKAWEPDPESEAMIADAKAVIASVPYRSTFRFVFYRMWQQGLIHLEAYSGKKDPAPSKKERANEKLKAVLSKARHNGFMDRDAMLDDRRNEWQPNLYASTEEFLRTMLRWTCELDPWEGEEVRPILAFEANAMLPQFQHWTKKYRVELWPFGGSPSIEYKNRLAERLSFELSAVVLYFGDYDPKGQEIAEDLGDVMTWTGREGGVYHVGLTKRQVDTFKLEDNPDKPGTYQWEALSDLQAGKVIVGALAGFGCDLEAVTLAERQVTSAYALAIAGLLEE